MHRLTRIVFTLLLVAAMCQTAVAEKRFYLGVTAGYSSVDGLADTIPNGPTTGIPSSVTLNGVPFDDSDVALGGFAGYQFHEYIAVELGYANLGTFRSVTLGFTETAKLETTELSARAKFRYPLGEKLSATWHLGVSTNSFDAEGQAVIAPVLGTIPTDPRGGGILFPLDPPPILEPLSWQSFQALQMIPLADPKDEIGYLWGFGINWRVSQRLSLDLNYTRHDAQVLEIDTLNLGVIVSL